MLQSLRSERGFKLIEGEGAVVRNDNDEREDRREAERRSGQDRRASDDDTLTGHLRAADTGISIGWRWAQIVVVLVCFGITIGTIVAKFNAMESVINNLSAQVSSITTANATTRAEIDQLRREVNALQSSKDTQDQINRVVGERVSRLEAKGD